MMYWSSEWRRDSECEEDGSSEEGAQMMEEEEEEDPHFLLHILLGSFDGCVQEGAGVGGELDASLWSKLPQEVVEMILATLPAASRFRFQAVCKKWRMLLCCGEFVLRSAGVSRQNSVPVVGAIEYRRGRRGRKRLHSDVSRLLSKCRSCAGTKVKLTFLPRKYRFFSRYVTQDGLACIIKPAQRRALARSVKKSRRECGTSSISFCVVNPVTKSWQEVPPEFGPDDIYSRDWSVKLVVERGGRRTGFKVVVMSLRAFQGNSQDRRLTVSIYCSYSKCWKLVFLEWGPWNEYNPHWPRHLLCNGLIYFARSFNHLVVHSLEDGKVVRRLTESDYNAQAEGRHEEMGDVCEILQHCGEMFCVAESVSRDRMRFEIWKLDESSLMWDRVSVLPHQLSFELEADLGVDEEREEVVKYYVIQAVVVGDCICLTVGVKVQQVRDWFHTHLLAYHIPDDSWQLICCGMDYDFHAIPYTMFTPTFDVVCEHHHIPVTHCVSSKHHFHVTESNKK